jgi:hypothetical protein
MRQGRRVRWSVGALGGLAVVVASTWGAVGCCDNGSSPLAEDSHTVTVTVETASHAPAIGAVVTVWIVDADLPGTERAPIVVGSAPTDAQGMVQFAYISVEPPYVCGYEVKSADATTVLAEQPAAVTNVLSTPSGFVTVVLP